MVNTITEYECSYCGKRFFTEEEAQDCSYRCEMAANTKYEKVRLVTYQIVFDYADRTIVKGVIEHEGSYYVSKDDQSMAYSYSGLTPALKLNKVFAYRNRSEITLIAGSVKPEDEAEIYTRLKHALYQSYRDISDMIWEDIMKDQENDKGKSENLS